MSFSVETDQTYLQKLQNLLLSFYYLVSLVFFDVHRTKTLFHFLITKLTIKTYLQLISQKKKKNYLVKALFTNHFI